MEIGGGLLGEACLGTRHCGWPLYSHYTQEGIGVSGTFSFLLCFYNLLLSAVVGQCHLAWWGMAMALALLCLLVVGAIILLKCCLVRARSRGRNKALLDEF